MNSLIEAFNIVKREKNIPHKLVLTGPRGWGSEIFISKGAQRVNAKSIMGVMMLAAGIGSTVKIEALGEDADQALIAIQALFDDKFGEGQ